MVTILVKDTICITIDRELRKRIDKIVADENSPFISRSRLIEYYLFNNLPKRDVSTVVLETKGEG